MHRQGERTEESLIQELAQRLKTLEDTVSRRALPPGYKFVVNGADLEIRTIEGALVATL